MCFGSLFTDVRDNRMYTYMKAYLANDILLNSEVFYKLTKVLTYICIYQFLNIITLVW